MQLSSILQATYLLVLLSSCCCPKESALGQGLRLIPPDLVIKT